MKPFVLIDGRPAQGRPRGMGIYVRRLLSAMALQARDFSLKVALDQKAGADPWPELNTVEKFWAKGSNPAVWDQSELPRLAAQSGAALLHCTANSSPWRVSIPYVVTIHDVIFLRRFLEIADTFHWRQLWAHLYYRYGIPPAARRARKVITDSEYSRAQLIAKLKLPPEKVKTILLATPHNLASLPEAKAEKILGEMKITRPYLLAFGAMDMRKNTANIVRAFARLPRAAASMLVLAGFEMAERSSIPGLIEHLGVKDRVRILDFVSEDQLTALYQNTGAFVYPSLDEGFGLPVLQAFALGVPVITSRAGSIPEIAGNAVRFANPHDPQGIAQELLTILVDSTEAHRMALSGYMQAKQFSWDKTAEETLNVYAECLAN